MFEPNADAHVPNYLSHYFKAYSTEPMENRNHIPGYNENIIAPRPSTSNDATIEPWIVDPGTYKDPVEEQLVPLCDTNYNGSYKVGQPSFGGNQGLVGSPGNV